MAKVTKGSSTGKLKVIKASAGSGKTFSLARTYLVDLLGYLGDDGKYHLRSSREYHRHILAITFTNKATEEMKTRIIKQLHLLSQGKGDYVGYFKKEFADPFNAVCAAASRALSDILFTYNSFSVSTIDSFFQLILRTFAREVDYDTGYEIEIDDSMALATAVNDLLLDVSTGRIGKSHPVFGWIKDYVRYLVDEKSKWNLFGNPSDLVKFSENINKEFYSSKGSEIEEYFSDMDAAGETTSETRIKRFCDAVSKEVENLENKLAGDHYKNRLLAIESDVAKFFGGRLLSRIAQGKPPTKESLKKASTGDVESLFKLDYYKQCTQNKIDEYVDFARDCLQDMLDLNMLKSLQTDIWQLGLLGAIDRKLHDNLRQSNTLLLGDTGNLIKKVVESTTTVDDNSFVYERVGTRYHNFMIDEFQDTSRLQYGNFKPLIGGGLSNGNDTLIIGDEKQAIYRWRNSDPSMLRDELSQDFSQYYSGTTLNDNYRSFAAVVNFNNVFFQYVPKQKLSDYKILQSTYNNVHQNVKNTEREGYVRINFIDNGTKVLPLLSESVRELQGRGYSYSDIMILVRRNVQGVKVVQQLLSENINVVSEESLLLKSSPAVRMVINALHFIESSLYSVPQDADESATATPLKRVVQAQRRYKLLHDFDKAVVGAGEGCDGGQILADVLEANREMAGATLEDKVANLAKETLSALPDPKTQPLHLVNIVDKVIERYLANESGECGRTASTFLTALQDDVIAFSGGRNGGSVREYLRYWDKNKEKLSLSSSSPDAVRVMTFHKAKGLESKVVLLPYLDWDMAAFNKNAKLWIDRNHWLNACGAGKPFMGIGGDCVPPLISVAPSSLVDVTEFSGFHKEELEKTLIDNFNNTYVAFTRPRQELHMWLERKTVTDPEKSVRGILNSFIDDLKAGKVSIETPSKDIYTPKFTILEAEDATEGFKEVGIEFGKKENNYVEAEKEDEYAVPVGESRLLPLYRSTKLAAPVRVRLDDSRYSHFGNEMHAVMNLVQNVNDLDHAKRVLDDRFPADSPDRPQAEEAFAAVRATIAGNALVAGWFAPENTVYTERQLSGRVEGLERTVSDNNRVDRFVVTPSGEAVVIDYKFGGDYRRETVDDYMAKVRDYLRLLRAAGYANVKGYLWIVRDKHHPVREVTLP